MPLQRRPVAPLAEAGLAMMRIIAALILAEIAFTAKGVSRGKSEKKASPTPLFSDRECAMRFSAHSRRAGCLHPLRWLRSHPHANCAMRRAPRRQLPI